jgi:hypothetical protein
MASGWFFDAEARVQSERNTALAVHNATPGEVSLQ